MAYKGTKKRIDREPRFRQMKAEGNSTYKIAEADGHQPYVSSQDTEY